MSDIKGIIFDKDGTLFDFGATWEVWASGFLLRICEGDRTKAAHLGHILDFDLDTQTFAKTSIVIAGTTSEIAQTLLPHVPQVSESALVDLLNAEAETAPQKEAVPLQPLLTELRSRGLRLGVATNDAEAPARAHLDQAGVTGQFDFIAGYDSGFGGKPAPGQLLAFTQQLEIPAEACVMVGDSTHDLIAGQSAGMRTFAVLTGLAEPEALSPLADVLKPDIGHLPAWLDSLTA